MISSEGVCELIQKNREGRPVVGCFPLYPPVELFESFGFLPVVLWNLKRSIKNLETSDRHIQPYACGIARELVQFAISERETLDAIFFYNACDTLRNLPEILELPHDPAQESWPVFRLHLPQVDRTQCNPLGYLENEVVRLIKEVENVCGQRFSPDRFLTTTEKYKVMRGLCTEAEDLVAQGRLGFELFCQTVLAGCASGVDAQIERLERLVFEARPEEVSTEKKRVVVSGIMPPRPSVIGAMEASGLCVVANDIASLKRSYGFSPEPSRSPETYYDALYSRHVPCTTLLHTSDERVETLVEMVSRSRAQGVIFCGEKFCEHEYFEFPYVKKRLSEMGISTLFLEFSVDDDQLAAAHATRVEAFAEMM